MIQEMVNGSIAVLTQPSVQAFERHERDNLVWALIYAVIASVINGVIVAFSSLLSGGGISELIAIILSAVLSTIIGSLIGWGIIYLLGRAFGGTGSFGELAWGLSLFSSPLAVGQGIATVIPFIGGIISLALTLYGVYLTYLAIQSGMNLPAQKALYIAIILAVIGILIVCATVGLATIAILLGGGFAP
ncbi:Yip1 family protein [uncultured Chloroflexus sp.]|uniref:Yip1 family protein n=1 Tax=uncultured Chloroflexus sp. TaxID=214040 RepID=UPI002609120E|nr:Yip1 family protein [uncultured Chloroflexus sp.]